jgi:hypothetical protein
MTQTSIWQRKPTETESVEMVHDSYLMHIHNVHCTRCRGGERYTDLYEVWIHPTKTRTTGLKQLRKYTGALKDMHVAYVELPISFIPICSDCVATYKSATDKTPLREADTASWAETLKRKYTPTAVAETKIARASSPAAKHIPTLDEL